MRNNKKKGFTLVELLVVIAILAILATVSVVGYTAYIESAYVSNDNTVVGQLNSFAGVLNADTSSELFDTEITEDNVWKATQIILKEMTAEDLKPHALDYGYNYYYNLSTKKFELIKEKDLTNSALRTILNVFAEDEALKPGFFKTKTGDIVFLVDTTGSELAEAVRGFYTFDHIEDGNKFNAFQNIVSKLGAEHQNIKNAAQNSVFVTTEGTVAAGESATGYVFHTESNLVMGESVTVTITTTVTIPSNVTTVQIGALDVVVEEGGSIVFEASAEELQNVLSDEFITEGTTFEVDGQEFILTDGANDGANAGTAVITPKADNDTTEYPLACSNYLADFDIFVDDTNKSYLSKQTNALNIPYVVWHTGSVELSLDPDSLKANDELSPLSSSRVTWKLTDENGDVATYTGVTLDNGVLTFSKVGNMYPNHSSIWVTATSVYPKGGENNATHTFEIKLSRGTGMAVTVDGNSATEVLWGEDASEDDGLKNSYTIGATLNAWANKVSDNFTYDDDVVLDESSDVLTVNGTTVETAPNILSGNTANTTISFDVIVGGYYKETVTLTLNHARVLYKIKNTDIKYIGTEGTTVSASDLFTLADGATAPTGQVKVNAYLGATAGASMSNLNPLPIGSSTNQAVYAEGDANANSVALSNGTFNLGLKSEANTATAKVVFVVTVDGVRASENYEVTVVNGTNAKDYTTLKAGEGTAKNIVLLSDVTMDVNNSYISVKNFYGNCFTFDIQKGTKQSTDAGSAVINLYGTMQDVKVIGRLHTGFGVSVTNEWGSCAVTTKATGAKILNSYISNCRSPLRVEADTTVQDSVFFGGRFSNIEIISAKKLTIEGEVVTINQPYEGQVGTGITAWYTATNYAKVVVNGQLTQYNFISKADAAYMPEISVLGVGADLGIIFEDLIEDPTYSGYLFGDSTKYVNAGIAYLNKVDTDENFVEPEFNNTLLTNAYQSTFYDLTAEKALPDGEKTITCWFGHGSAMCGCRALFREAMESLLGEGTTSMKNVIYSYHNTTGSYGHTVFASQAGAVAKYKPGTVSAPVYDFVNGSIIH